MPASRHGDAFWSSGQCERIRCTDLLQELANLVVGRAGVNMAGQESPLVTGRSYLKAELRLFGPAHRFLIAQAQ